MAKDEILVVGAGIIGLTTVHELLRAGHRKIRLVDSGSVAGATSFGHTAMISVYSAYSLDPALIHVPVEQGGFKHEQAKFGTLPPENWGSRRFSKKEIKEQLSARSNLARAGINSMITEPDKALEAAGFYFDRGIRYYFDDERAKRDAKNFRKLDIKAEVEATNFKSAKTSITFPSGCMNIYEYCTKLAALERTVGVRIDENTRVDYIGTKHGKLSYVTLNGETEEFQSVVICTGADKNLLSNINPDVAAAIAPFTGVSVNARIPENRARKLPKVFQVAYEEHGNYHIISISNIRHEGHAELRLAGFFAAGVLQKGAKFDFAANELKRFLRKIAPDHEEARVWQGVRPMTADGLPIIGKDPKIDGVYYNVGHGSSGVPLCRGSAIITAEYLNAELMAMPKKMFGIDLDLLSPQRCNARGK